MAKPTQVRTAHSTKSTHHWLLPAAPYETYAAYTKATGESALTKARKATSDHILAEVERSGLRGRGGGGFPTGTKWGTIRKHPCAKRTVICNAAEGEPGTFKDRWLIRKNPYAVLEGMLIAAHVVGTHELYIAIKESFRKEIERLQQAIEELKSAGVLDGYTVKIAAGPEEYLFGEEKALLNVLEGHGPLPREAHYPPYERGLRGTAESPNPALVNNVETFAHVPSIVRHGADSFRKLGTSDTPGTLLFTLCGDIEKPGVYEAEAGIPLRELFFRLGGGPRGPRSFKAAICGVSAAVIGPEKFETRADFGSLRMINAGLGSGGFMLIDDETSVPRVAQAVARFLYVESCNQCTACKHGLRTASSAIDELFDAKTATPDDYERALFGARSAPQGNRCFLPQGGSLIISSLLTRFKGEFDAQLSRPKNGPGRWRLPKIADYDEASKKFLYDVRQDTKNPDWTYKETQNAPTTGRFTAASPTPEGEAGVRLAHDVWESMQHLADAKGLDLDRQVNDALRDWLKRGRK
ncbi:MAG TPA: NADH-ubiquinone oxidoreductase-F iron-sulfur binding region domain-containing protein [Planctomycetota bacterium]|jgi:NADH:ubiquinone oxidoreductase subunit F (NADH-binding)|nr:NADH-ubiquinone oxidoreductase-F iron-sulfur binding region domain-containing protein [Planctomycetota bacterium]